MKSKRRQSLSWYIVNKRKLTIIKRCLIYPLMPISFMITGFVLLQNFSRKKKTYLNIFPRVVSDNVSHSMLPCLSSKSQYVAEKAATWSFSLKVFKIKKKHYFNIRRNQIEEFPHFLSKPSFLTHFVCFVSDEHPEI